MGEKLTEQQKLAIDNRGGKLLVSAAAGSGKTKVLVDRLLKYLMDENDPANLDDFLIITYTQAAASELRGKIAAKLSERISEQPENKHLLQQLQRIHLSKISTVHAFCTDILRENAYRLDIPVDFRVADENECAELKIRALQTVLEEAYSQGIGDDDFYVFVDSQGAGRDDRDIPDIVLKVHKNSMCHLNPEKWLEQCMTDLEGITDISECIWGRYLIEDLHTHLDEQIKAYSKCAEKMEESGEMPKPAALFRDTLSQLMSLRARTLWDDIVNHKDIEYGKMVFPRKCVDLSLVEDAKYLRKTLKAKLEMKLSKFAESSKMLIEDYRQTIAAERGLVALVRKFTKEYEKLKRGRRVLDFTDLEHKTLDLLLGKNRSAGTKIAEEIALRFREIMVDEYQDSNEVQEAIFNVLTEKRQNCFMVGDVKQSIYQFRLAEPSIFIEKYNSYASAETAQHGQGRKVLLSSNFRSSGDVIDAVNDVFSACMSPKVGGLHYGDDESLKEGIPHIPLNDASIELYGVDVQENAYPEEAAFVANRILELLDGKHMIRDNEGLRPIKSGDIAILLRSPKSTGRWFQRALENAGIRYATENGENLFHAEENEVLFSFLKVINNPLLDIPLAAVLLSRVFSFTTDEIAKIRGEYKQGSLFMALQRANSEKAKNFLEMLSKLRLEAQRNSLSGLMMRILSLTHIDSIYSAMADGSVRAENLQAFLRLVSSYEQSSNGGISGLVDHLELLEQSGKIVLADQDVADAVSIMSIHKSKGLEFPVVFVCALAREFSMLSLNAQALCHKEMGIGLPFVDFEKRVKYPSIAKRAIYARMKEEMISEEMRVLYVALTRAKDRLILTYAANDIINQLNKLETNMRLLEHSMLVSSVNCPGTWVWIASIINRSGKWHRQIVKAGDLRKEMNVDMKQKAVSPEIIHILDSGLKFSYPHLPATTMPSKQTATQLKGRDKDQEAAENSIQMMRPSLTWRKPAFVNGNASGIGHGTAMHAVMQHIRFEKCKSTEGVRLEIDRLVSEGYISDEYAAQVSPEQIAAFFQSEIGLKIMSQSENVLREFKFTLLVDGEAENENCADDKILLQGVVDCALIDSEGITVIDFKSDRVSDTTLPIAIEMYSLQIKTYAEALSRIYELPIKSALLYFFHLNRFVSVI